MDLGPLSWAILYSHSVRHSDTYSNTGTDIRQQGQDKTGRVYVTESMNMLSEDFLTAHETNK